MTVILSKIKSIGVILAAILSILFIESLISYLIGSFVLFLAKFADISNIFIAVILVLFMLTFFFLLTSLFLHLLSSITKSVRGYLKKQVDLLFYDKIYQEDREDMNVLVSIVILALLSSFTIISLYQTVQQLTSLLTGIFQNFWILNILSIAWLTLIAFLLDKKPK